MTLAPLEGALNPMDVLSKSYPLAPDFLLPDEPGLMISIG